MIDLRDVADRLMRDPASLRFTDRYFAAEALRAVAWWRRLRGSVVALLAGAVVGYMFVHLIVFTLRAILNLSRWL